MVLEVIADPANKHQASIDLIDHWRDELMQRKLMFIDDQDAIHSLESLDRELLVRKEASVRSRIRHTAKRLSHYLTSDERESLDKDAVNAYDERSALVHKGQISKGNIGELVSKGQRAVKLL
jgi:ribosomal protein S20